VIIAVCSRSKVEISVSIILITTNVHLRLKAGHFITSAWTALVKVFLISILRITVGFSVSFTRVSRAKAIPGLDALIVIKRLIRESMRFRLLNILELPVAV
jgi:hypothetical protein